MNAEANLTELQRDAARLFFELPESRGFILAGGAALIASGLVERRTQDLDLFAVDKGATRVTVVADAFEGAAGRKEWAVERIIDQQEFVRLRIVRGAENLIIDLGRDSPAVDEPRTTFIGPALSDRDLAARKTLALFSRAEGRDFADVYALAQRFGRDTLLSWAANQDPGFDETVFAEMLDALRRLSDDEVPVAATNVPALRDFFARWAAKIR